MSNTISAAEFMRMMAGGKPSGAGRVAGGRAAKRHGGEFERTIEASAHRMHNVLVRIADGCRRIGGNKLIRVAQAFDYCGSVQGTAIFLDVKSVADEASFPLANVSDVQRAALIALDKEDQLAGLLVWNGRGREYLWLPGGWLNTTDTRLHWESPVWTRLGPDIDAAWDKLIDWWERHRMERI